MLRAAMAGGEMLELAQQDLSAAAPLHLEKAAEGRRAEPAQRRQRSNGRATVPNG
jgi:hypothetical protein